MGFSGAFSGSNSSFQKKELAAKQKASQDQIKKAIEKLQLPGHQQQGPPIQTTGANG